MTDAATPLRILLVEDEPVNRALFRAVLGRATDPAVRDATVFEAGTLAEGRAVAAAEALDVIFLDVRLPDGSGLSLADELRAANPEREVAVVILSASVLASERSAALETGADHFLGKPYRPQELLDLLDQLRRRPPDAG